MLIGRGPSADYLAGLKKGSQARVTWHLRGRPEVAISGNKVLLHAGVRRVVDDREMHPRTAIGIDYDTGHVLMLVVDGRQSFSRGYTMVELANLMQALGADDALNLDGGGSSTMLGLRTDGVLDVLNSPSDGFERQVANGLEVTYRP
jgi:exopolysaccharide biosynthesis protein